MSEYQSTNSNDWKDREFIEIIQLNILQMTSFLNQLNERIREKLNVMNQRLEQIENQLEFYESYIQ